MRSGRRSPTSPPLLVKALALFSAFLVALVAVACSSQQSSPKTGGACSTNADCPATLVCGYANADGSYGDCSAKGICVVPVSPQPTQMCGCNGQAIELVVDDVDAGVYYWSGPLYGEMGFPPCSDAAVIAWNDSGNPGRRGDDGASDGPSESSTDGAVDATIDGSADGGADASPDALADATPEASADGATDAASD